jgi:fatty acid desaturase
VLHQSLTVIIIANLISGFFTAVVLVGNHEKEKIFTDRIGMPFLEHQIIASRNYDYNGLFWLMMMGGMQYQTEHHFFP